jgi:tetratricopeptide (TPR) repeat protein
VRRPSLGLAMIVKNEADVIGRCLASVGGLIDCWTVCDTGSTDGTPQLVTEHLSRIPGRLHHRSWRDFGSNRTELLALARGTADHLLLLDADLTVELRGDLLALLDGNPAQESFSVEVRSPDESFSYWMPYLVRGDLPWFYRGRTHEYLTLDHPTVPMRQEVLTLVDHADGANRADKFVRDLVLLDADIADEPQESRHHFYRARTLQALDRTREAVQAYRHCLTLPGWDEQVFSCHYQLGLLLAPTDWPAAIAEHLTAWNLRPHRAEPLWALAAGLRERGEHHAAELFAERGLALPEPDDILFVESWIYHWGLLFEYSIASHWTGHPDRALRACDQLLARADLPASYREQVVRNRVFSTERRE